MIVMINTFDQIPLSGPWKRCFCFSLFVIHFFLFFLIISLPTHICLQNDIFINLKILYVTENDLTLT